MKTKTAMVTENKETPPSSPPDGNSNALFVAVTNLNAHMMRCASTAHGAAPVLGAQRLALDDHGSLRDEQSTKLAKIRSWGIMAELVGII